jgi:hypothetical protein
VEERQAAGCALESGLYETLRSTGLVPDATLAAMRARYETVCDDVRNRFTDLEAATVLFVNNAGGWIAKQPGFPLPDVPDEEGGGGGGSRRRQKTGGPMAGGVGGVSLHQRLSALFAIADVGTRLMVVEKVPDIHAGRLLFAEGKGGGGSGSGEGGIGGGGWVEVVEIQQPSTHFSWMLPNAGNKVRVVCRWV